jgi:glycosyltransferase involved in cell wall biosynthesis
LRALRGVKGEIEVDIVGPVEDETYWKACQRERDQLGENVTVRVCGPADHASVRKRFQGSDLFLFPTLGENFGHVIAEALGSGCPVLLSDRTPWRELEKAGVGWDVPLETPEVFRELIQRCVDMDEEEHRAMRDAAFAYARKRLEDPAAIEANRRLFRVAFGEEAGVDSK